MINIYYINKNYSIRTQILSISERFNGSTENHKSRLLELDQAKKIVADLLLNAKAKNVMINMNSTIELSLQSV
ncbi:deoxyadenosine/deoxycytidine kinase [Pedobacter sp. UYP30]|uniref:hypothetical protein n=1 Tax=Pedobacter sp. UYP30 TaxID=1756400 RepID=UPI00339871FC